MNIDIQAIVNEKLKEMEEGKILENLISKTVEEAVTKAVTSTIDGYSIKRIIENKIEEDVKKGVESVGFCAYNTIVAEQVKNLINSVIKEDVAEKVNKIFTDVMINKRETIKLSEIIDKYKELYDDLEYDDLDGLDEGHFHVVWDNEETEYSSKYIKIILSHNEQKKSMGLYSNHYSGSNEKKLELYLSRWKDELTANILSVTFEDAKLDDLKSLRNMSDFEAFLANLYLNNTTIELDIESEDDIDSYVGGEYFY